MKTIKIRVTKADIEAGKCCSSISCPIALAIQRCCKPKFLSVGYDVCINSDWDIPLPAAANQFIRDFDGGRPVKPFTFSLTIP